MNSEERAVVKSTLRTAGHAGRLRHPAEVPFYVFMVVLNAVIVVTSLRAAMVLPFLPARWQHSDWAIAVRTALLGLVLSVPGRIVVGELRRSSVLETAVVLSSRRYPQLYKAVEDFTVGLRFRRRPQIFLVDGIGMLNAFAGQATGYGYDFVVLSKELFANLYNNDREGLRFVLGHELGHIRLHHVSVWYRLSVAYSQRIPLLGPALSRLCEYSCDRHGAYLSPSGVTGLVLLTSGRHTENEVDVMELVGQGRMLRGFRVGLAQLPRSHPFAVRRLEHLFRIGLFQPGGRCTDADTLGGSVR